MVSHHWEHDNAGSQAALLASGRPSPARPRILLVEDNLPVGESIGDGLRRHGYDVNWVHDGFQAVAAFEADPPDAIVMDLMLPYMTGTASTRQIRREQPGLPIIGISGLANSEMIREFMAAGGSAFVDKRRLVPDLFDVLNSVIEPGDQVEGD